MWPEQSDVGCSSGCLGMSELCLGDEEMLIGASGKYDDGRMRTLGRRCRLAYSWGGEDNETRKRAVGVGGKARRTAERFVSAVQGGQRVGDGASGGWDKMMFNATWSLFQRFESPKVPHKSKALRITGVASPAQD